MTQRSSPRLLPTMPARSGLALLAMLGCGDGTGPDAAPVRCDGVTPTTLAVGAHAILDPAGPSGCLRLPAADAAGAEYLVVAYSANGEESANGVRGGFTLRGVADNFAPLQAAAHASPRLSAFQSRLGPAAFDGMLRARERALAAQPATALARRGPPAAVVPPTPGSSRSFRVCRTTSCGRFVTVVATAQYVGSRAAIYLDDTVPAGGLTPGEITAFGSLFDQHLYAIDTAAFGRESDIDGNGVVAVLLSDAINALSPNCQSTGSVIVGYFFGLDLLPGEPNSNGGEVFYGLVPDPSKPACAGKSRVLDLLPPTFLHEFQHMISFNRHVLLAGGESEQTWLNEALSHFAEELGGRRVPSGFCTNNNCLNQFARGNLLNAFDYLTAPEATYLVEPGSSGGTLRERGANWLFLRWFADQSPTDSLLGTDLTRRLLGADQPGGLTSVGGANITAAAQLIDPGLTFGALAGQWHLANYVERLPAFAEPTGRIRFRSWDLASAFDQILPGPYPLAPDSTAGIGYRGQGVLLGGSGTYLRVVQPANGGAVALALDAANAAAVQPRFAILRLR